jgi:hypothetical protein
MAVHLSFDFTCNGFRETVPSQYHEAARPLEAVVRPHIDKLILGKCSVRTQHGKKYPTQFCHYVYLVEFPDIQLAVFNVEANRAVYELYCVHVLREEVWENAADTGTKVSLRPRFYVLPPGEARRAGYLTVEEAIDRLGMAIDDAEAAATEGRLKARWKGEAIAMRVVDLMTGIWHRQASPDWLAVGRSKPIFDLLDLDLRGQRVIEVMGPQHFDAVGLYGGERKRLESNMRTAHKVRVCKERGVPLLFVRWNTGSVLDVMRREPNGLRSAAERFELALSRSQRSLCGWIDLDEFESGRRFSGYNFLRDLGFASAID